MNLNLKLNLKNTKLVLHSSKLTSNFVFWAEHPILGVSNQYGWAAGWE